MYADEIILKKKERYTTDSMDDSIFGSLSIIITNHNSKDALIDTLKSVVEIDGLRDLIIVDNGSTDDSVTMIAELGCNYISFDEGMQSWGKVWNTVTDAFELGEFVLCMDAGFVVDKDCLLWLLETARDKDTGICAPLFIGANHPQMITDALVEVEASYADVLGVCGHIICFRQDIMGACGKFDEELIYPDNVCIDYGFRLLKSGFKIRVSERAFADYSGDINFRKLAFPDGSDRKILKDRYGMNYFNRGGNSMLINVIDRGRDERFHALEIGCDMGATLLEIKRRFPNAITKGLELNEAAASLGALMSEIKQGNIESLAIPYDEKFDYIIFGDVLEHLHNTEAVVSYCRKILKPNGRIIANIPNLMHISVMEQLLNGRFSYTDTGLLDRTHIHFFTYYEILDLFELRGYEIEKIASMKDANISELEQRMIETLVSLSNKTQEAMYTAFQYLVVAKRI